jgi:Lrp/AsnC family leucine-responsive transcriptional regulator
MDEIDRQLLTLLQQNGRLSYHELGARVGLSTSAINERVKKLQAAGVIQGTVTLVDPKVVGLDLCAFMQVLTSEPHNERIFLERLQDIPEVQECHHVTGEFSYLLKIRTRNTSSFEGLMKQIKELPGVVRTHTIVSLSSPKDTTAVPLYPNTP